MKNNVLFFGFILLITNVLFSYAQESTVVHDPLTQDSSKANCISDPIEETTQLVLAHMPIVLNSFIKIVQEPNNHETVAQSISTIVTSIANIAVSAFKEHSEREAFEVQLRHALTPLLCAHAMVVRQCLQ